LSYEGVENVIASLHEGRSPGFDLDESSQYSGGRVSWLLALAFTTAVDAETIRSVFDGSSLNREEPLQQSPGHRRDGHRGRSPLDEPRLASAFMAGMAFEALGPRVVARQKPAPPGHGPPRPQSYGLPFRAQPSSGGSRSTQHETLRRHICAIALHERRQGCRVAGVW
jgi:hypothetical protein